MFPVIYTLKASNSTVLAGSRARILLPDRKSDHGFHRHRSVGDASTCPVNSLMKKVKKGIKSSENSRGEG